MSRPVDDGSQDVLKRFTVIGTSFIWNHAAPWWAWL